MDSRSPLSEPLYEAENKSQMPYHYTTGARSGPAAFHGTLVSVLPLSISFPRARRNLLSCRQEHECPAGRLRERTARGRAQACLRTAVRTRPFVGPVSERIGKLAAPVHFSGSAP